MPSANTQSLKQKGLIVVLRVNYNTLSYFAVGNSFSHNKKILESHNCDNNFKFKVRQHLFSAILLSFKTLLRRALRERERESVCATVCKLHGFCCAPIVVLHVKQ